MKLDEATKLRLAKKLAEIEREELRHTNVIKAWLGRLDDIARRRAA